MDLRLGIKTLTALGLAATIWNSPNASGQEITTPNLCGRAYQDFVPSNYTAIRMAEAVLSSDHAESDVANARPFDAKLVDRRVWVVRGRTPKDGQGVAPVVNISRKDGCVLKVVNTRGRDERTFVLTEVAAVRIAEAVLSPIYGTRKISSEKPFQATLKADGVWLVSGTLPTGRIGGTAWIQISRNGCIITACHGK